MAGSAFRWLVATQAGFVTAHLCAGHVNLVLQYALLPWFFLYVIRLTRSPGAGSAAGLSIVTSGWVFAGHPQVAYYGILVGLLWTCGSLAVGKAADNRGRVIAWGLVSVVTATLLSCVQLLPVLELARNGFELAIRS